MFTISANSLDLLNGDNTSNLIAVAIAALIVMAVRYRMNYFKSKLNTKIPCKPPVFPWGNAENMQDMIHGLGELVSEKYQDPETKLSTFWMFGEECVAVRKAEHVRQVYAAEYDRKDVGIMRKHVNMFMGENNVTMLHGAQWKAVRGILTKAFHHTHLKGMTKDMVDCSNELVATLKQEIGQGEINFFTNIKKATLDIIGKAAFGYDFGCTKLKAGDSPPVATAFQFMLDEVGRRMNSLKPADMMYSLPTSVNKKYLESQKLLRGVIDELVEKRKKEMAAAKDPSEIHDDLLKFVLEAAKTEDTAMTADVLTDNMIVMLFAGFDTSSITLTYVMAMMAKHPEVEKKLHEEVDRVLAGGRDPVYEDIAKLKYCNAVIKEALRLFPAAPITVRHASKPITIGNTVIPPGMGIYVPIWHIQRDAYNWEDPLKFDPERFGEGVKVKPGSWIPFSAGQRSCVGQRMAMMEAVLVLAILVRDLRFTVRADYELTQTNGQIVQSPKGGLPVEVHARR